MEDFKQLNERLEKLLEDNGSVEEAEKNKGTYKESGIVDEIKENNWNPVYYSEDGKFFVKALSGYERIYFNTFDELLNNKEAIELTKEKIFVKPEDEIVGTAYQPLDEVSVPIFDPYDAIQIGRFYVYYPETSDFYYQRHLEEDKKAKANAKFDYEGKEYIKDIKKEKQSPNYGKPSKYDIDEDTIYFEINDDGDLTISGDVVDGIPYGIKDIKTAVNYVINDLSNNLDREMYKGCRWKYIPVFDGDTEAKLEVELLGYPI